MPPYVRKPTMLGDPSVVAGWRFLSADAATGTGPRTLGATTAPRQPPPQQQQRTQQRNDVETFLQAAGDQLWHGADVDEDALVDRVEALLAGPEEAAAEAELQLPQIPSGRGRDQPAEQLAEGGEGPGGVNFDEYVYSTVTNAGTVRESLGAGGAVTTAPSGLSAPSSMESLADPGAEGTTSATSDRPASRPVEEQPGAAASTDFGVNRTGHGVTAGMGRVGRTPRGARTGQVVPLPSVAVDSSFTYTPRQARARPARYGAWYLPIKSWQKGGAPKPPPQLTKEQKEKIEETSQKRATMAAAVKTAACPIAFKEYLRHQRACEALEVLEQAKSALGEGQLEEIAAMKADFINYKLSSRELQKRIRELLAGGPIHRQQLGLQVRSCLLACLRAAKRRELHCDYRYSLALCMTAVRCDVQGRQ